MLGVICTPNLAQRAADLPDRGVCAKRFSHGGQEVRVAFGDAAYLGDCGGTSACIPLGSHQGGALALAPFALRVNLEELDPLGPVLRELVDADDDALACFYVGLVTEGGGLDLAPYEPALGPALLVCATELATRDRIDALVAALAGSRA